MVDGITFIFPDQWEVFKYDEWSFYRNRFQSMAEGQKAVDIVAVEKNKNELWLIEVKDYRQHRRTKAVDLPLETALKVRDSLAGIFTAAKRSDDSTEKCQAENCLSVNNIKVALQLEQPVKNSKLFPRAIDISNISLKLKSLVKAVDYHPLVIDSNKNQNKAGWQLGL